MLTGQVPVLKCQSVERTLEFYKDTLGFIEIKTRKPEKQLEWAYLNSGKAFLMLELDETLPKNHTDTIRLYFFTDNIESFHQYVKAKQYSVSDLETTKYRLKQCLLIDPDGRKIQIGETLS